MIRNAHYVVVKTVSLILILLIFGRSKCETIEHLVNSVDGKYAMIEDTLLHLYADMYTTNSDEVKMKINNKIEKIWKNTLSDPSSFDHLFDTIKYVGQLISEDNKIRVFTWNVPFNDGKHHYSGFIQYNPRRDSVILFHLLDKSSGIKNPESASLSPSNWFGSLYYQILREKYKGEIHYVLLGYDMNNLFTNKKLVEILYFDDDHIAHFGKPIIKTSSGIKNRILFEYSKQATMTLRYNEELEMIIYDHLAPFEARYKGIFQFYGPDFSYDGLLFEKGIWIEKTNIDVRN